MKPGIEIDGARLTAPGGRVLFDGLRVSLSRERVALVGRNGVGKSTLLRTLGGDPREHGDHIHVRGRVHMVSQPVDPARDRTPRFMISARALAQDHAAAGLRAPAELVGASRLSHGELRKLMLIEAKWSRADVLLLDEPTGDLDAAGVAWLREWLAEWPTCVLVASHDRRLLGDFQHFFIACETGCRALTGTLADLDSELEREQAESQMRYTRALDRLAEQEEHTVHIARRRARKKQFGRSRELDRGTPHMRLNQKRSYAQEKHGRMARVRAARLADIRALTKSFRRALDVSLPLALQTPTLPPDAGRPLLTVSQLEAVVDGRRLFASLDFTLGRERLAVAGENGTGKTTLLEMVLGMRRPTAGQVLLDRGRVGAILQCGADWLRDESLLEVLHSLDARGDSDAISAVLVAHKFPLALAERPLRSLSPGERVRAALIALFQTRPALELLVLDEPTYSLDLVGQRALVAALTAWPGGLLVASHDDAFLAAIGVDRRIELVSGAGPSVEARHEGTHARVSST